jgi:hypothetical protein
METTILRLVTTRGPMTTPTHEAGRPIHNQTAGAPQSVEAARSLSDLTHNVYVPLMDPKSNELLFCDIWYDPTGLTNFFSNPQVEEGGKAIFAKHERTIWRPATDIVSYCLLAPYGTKDFFLGLIRGTVKSRDAAKKLLNESRQAGLQAARRMGSMSHAVYFREPVAGGDTTLEVLGVDMWSDMDGMMAYYKQYDTGLDAAFAGKPEATLWKRPAGEWVEW